MQSYAQYKEDLKILDIFKDVPGFFIDVGFNDGIEASNTYLLEQHNWQGIGIEPIPELAEIAASNRNCKVICAAITNKQGYGTLVEIEGATGLSSLVDSKKLRKRGESYNGQPKEIQVKLQTLDSVLGDNDIQQIDLLSIDVEGHELAVLEGLSIKKFGLRIIIIEDNSRGRSFIVPRYLAKSGYIRFDRTGVNDWYCSVSDNELLIQYSRIKLFLKLIRCIVTGIPKDIALKILPLFFIKWIRRTIQKKYND